MMAELTDIGSARAEEGRGETRLSGDTGVRTGLV
jgi:hypothetical protein